MSKENNDAALREWAEKYRWAIALMQRNGVEDDEDTIHAKLYFELMELLLHNHMANDPTAQPDPLKLQVIKGLLSGACNVCVSLSHVASTPLLAQVLLKLSTYNASLDLRLMGLENALFRGRIQGSSHKVEVGHCGLVLLDHVAQASARLPQAEAVYQELGLPVGLFSTAAVVGHEFAQGEVCFRGQFMPFPH